MYDIIARRRLSTVLRYIFDFLPKEETSIHLNTKKAVLSNRRNSDTEPYIMLNIFFVEDIFSPRWAEANKSRRCVLPGLRLSGSGQAAFPLPLFSLTFRFPLFYCTTVCVSKLFNADTAPLRRQTIKAPYTVRPLSSGSRQTSFPLPLFSLTFRFPLFYRATVCVSKLFNTDTAPLRRQTNQDALPCPVFVFPVPGKPRFPFRSFLSPFGFRFFTAPPYAFQNSSILPQLRCGGRQIKTPYTVRLLSSRSPANFVSPSALFSPFGFRFFTAPPYAFQNSSILPQLRCGGRQIKTPYTVRRLSSGSRHVTPGFKGYLFDGGDYLKVLEGVLLC